MDANTFNDTHTQPFDAGLFVTAGEITVNFEGSEKTCLSSDSFSLAAKIRHTEKVGPERVSYAAGQRDPNFFGPSWRPLSFQRFQHGYIVGDGCAAHVEDGCKFSALDLHVASLPKRLHCRDDVHGYTCCTDRMTLGL